ncbi:hypothetical protein KP509_27G038000 [Ceratopteris richardii]|uniref:Hydrophobic seed protein domain-containing protein n=1 Tax=Ceratopteris richardii TaxID=49495 RepID=A0A8T2RFL9_CERRI|nr:hypothetical protein KP509_27G038000 [Ceratopteris richardii]
MVLGICRCFIFMVLCHSVLCMQASGCLHCATYPSRDNTPVISSGLRNCPVDIVKLHVGSPLLSGLLGTPMQSDCSALLGVIGVDLEICLCAAINANVPGVFNVHTPKLDIAARIASSQLCGHAFQPSFTCGP